MARNFPPKTRMPPISIVKDLANLSDPTAPGSWAWEREGGGRQGFDSVFGLSPHALYGTFSVQLSSIISLSMQNEFSMRPTMEILYFVNGNAFSEGGLVLFWTHVTAGWFKCIWKEVPRDKNPLFHSECAKCDLRSSYCKIWDDGAKSCACRDGFVQLPNGTCQGLLVFWSFFKF